MMATIDLSRLTRAELERLLSDIRAAIAARGGR
jgi:hypothetical protein